MLRVALIASLVVSGWAEAREGWSRDVRVVRRRARVAIAGLIAMGAVAAFTALTGAWHIVLLGSTDVAASTWRLANTLREVGGLLELGLGLLAGVVFLRWLARAVALAGELDPVRGFSWTPSEAVLGFFIPVVNLVQPYRVLRDLHDGLAPEAVLEPAPRPLLDGGGGYRRVEMAHAPRAGAVHHAALGAWWGCYVASRGLGWLASTMPDLTVAEFIRSRYVFIASDAASIAAAWLAVRMIRAIDSRVAERHRRLAYASEEELDQLLVERDIQLRRDMAKIADFDDPA
ncbi:hypothetical protein predicted by Glimmer/Critica [Sorangium cellulosum So ce56]|uniref:DUF4328 domain-containing protein n=1 Tax=Sorangium cellulosum (strain So ce56) TaxID=448385 RepID=A9G930_SORC5|nr:hypothetical protein predicted by Glimmer/Critica [Sorangium cellulosum So ce56]